MCLHACVCVHVRVPACILVCGMVFLCTHVCMPGCVYVSPHYRQIQRRRVCTCLTGQWLAGLAVDDSAQHDPLPRSTATQQTLDTAHSNAIHQLNTVHSNSSIRNVTSQYGTQLCDNSLSDYHSCVPRDHIILWWQNNNKPICNDIYFGELWEHDSTHSNNIQE